MNLVIVESPAKAKTINKYLGKDYLVLASYGHIRDLPSKNGSVDPENKFQKLEQLCLQCDHRMLNVVQSLQPKRTPTQKKLIPVTSDVIKRGRESLKAISSTTEIMKRYPTHSN